MTTTEYVFASDLAREAGVEKSVVLKALRKQRIPTMRRRDPAFNNQRAIAVTREIADCYLAQRRDEGYGSIGKTTPIDAVVEAVMRLSSEQRAIALAQIAARLLAGQ